MENSEKIFFDDPKSQWYVAIGGESWLGPLSAADVYDRIKSGNLSWAHYIWKAGQSTWKRICNISAFDAAVPGPPPKSLQAEVKEVTMATTKMAPPPFPGKQTMPPPAEKIWFLHYNDSQFGPFSGSEVSRFLNVGKIHGGVYGWKEGMTDWMRLDQITDFTEGVMAARRVRAAEKTRPVKVDQVEQRRAPRKPLVARILLAHTDSVIAAVCRDISIGGMQILTDQVPGASGARIKINVCPSDGLSPFVAEGQIVRVLEDGRGFSFRFEKLDPGAQAAIEKYITSG